MFDDTSKCITAVWGFIARRTIRHKNLSDNANYIFEHVEKSRLLQLR